MRLITSQIHINSLRIKQGIIIPVLLGVLLTLGTNAATRAYIPFNSPSLYIQMALYTAICVIGFAILDCAFDAAARFTAKRSDILDKPKSVALCRFDYSSTANATIKDALRIGICWLPYLILMYPGVLYWDTGDQVGQFFRISAWNMEPGQIWDHHPFFDTFIYGSIIWIGHAITGSYAFGIFLHSVFQFIIFCISFALCLGYLAEKKLSRCILSVLTGFICFFPFFPVMALSMSKDVTNGMFFLLWCVLFAKVVDSNLVLLKRPAFVIVFVIVSLSASLTKKMGMYIIVVSLLVLLFVKARKRFKIACTVLAVVLLALVNVVLPRYAYPAWNIVPGGKQAAIVMPLQMFGRAAHDYPDDVSDAERQAVENILYSSWKDISEKYNPYISDPVTGFAIKEGSRKALLKAWITIGLRHPDSYINSFFSLESGWIAFTGASSIDWPKQPYSQSPVQLQPMTHSHINKDTFGKLYASENTDNIGQESVRAVLDTVRSIPIINVLTYVAVWTAVLPMFVLYREWRRRKDNFSINAAALYAPYFISVLSLFVYPVSLSTPNDGGNGMRYMFHTLLLAPMIVGLLLASTENSHQ